jgi:hypothetical protein
VAEPLTGVLGADFSKFVAACESSAAAMKGMQDSSGRMENALNNMAESTDKNALSVLKLAESYVTGEAAIRLAEAAFESLFGLLTSSVDAAAEAEQAQQKLVAALQAQGTNMPSVIAAYDSYASAMVRTTTFSEEATKAAEGTLVLIGGVMPKDMKAALDASANLASGLGKDLPDAAMLLSKALEGNTGALRRQGVVFDETKGQALSFGDIVDGINAKFSGQSDAALNTYAGRLKQLGNTWDEFKEAIGRVITENATVLKAFDDVSNAIDHNTGELKDNQTASNLVSDAVILAVKSFGLLLTTLDVAYATFAGGKTLLESFSAGVLNLAADTYDLAAAWDKFQLHFQLWNTAPLTADMHAMEAAATSLRAKIVDWDASVDKTNASSMALHETISGLTTNLDNMVKGLEATRGKTVEHTGAIKENSDAWDRNTVSLAGAKGANEQAAKAAAELNSMLMTQFTSQSQLWALQEKQVASHFGLDVQIQMLQQLAATEHVHALAVADEVTSEKDRQKIYEEDAKRQLEIETQIAALRKQQSDINIASMLRELDARTKLNAAYGRDLAGNIAVGTDAMERYRLKVIDITTTSTTASETAARMALAEHQLADDLLKDAVAQDTATAARAKGTAATDASTAATQKASAAIQQQIGAITDLSTITNKVNPNPETFSGLQGFRSTSEQANFAAGIFQLPVGGDELLRRLQQNYIAAQYQLQGEGRASGGPVDAGTPYLVGEQGPELFVPQASGAIVPLAGPGSAAGAGASSAASPSINVVVNVNGSMLSTPTQLANAVQQAMVTAYRQRGNRLPV